jgi:hypothetical protein
MGSKGTYDLLVVNCKLVNLVSFREDDNDEFNITENIKLEFFLSNPFLHFKKVAWLLLGF